MPKLSQPARRCSRWTSSSLAALSLAGCALQGPSAPPAGHRYDGIYVGQTALTRGGGFICGIPDLPRQIMVVDGRFNYPFQEQAPSLLSLIPVQIAADGSFTKATTYQEVVAGPRYDYVQRWFRVTGRVAGNTLEMTESDARCTRHSVLRRQ